MKKYLSITFALSWLLMFIACFNIEKLGVTYFKIALVIIMFMPAVGALLSGYKLKDFKWKVTFKGKIKYWLLAWFLPVIVTILGTVLYFLIFPKAFDLSGAYLIAEYGEDALKQLEDAGMSPATYALVSTFAAIAYAPFINMIPSIGEELGWHGVMTPYYKEKYGKKGLLLAGLIWGVWHWPLIALVGYEYGTGYFGAPFTGMLLFIIICIALEILIDYVYERTDCILAAALFHGSFNAVSGIGLLVLNPNYVNELLGPAPIGIIAAIPLFAVAIYIYCKDE